jgi:hypothetical protein
MTLKVALEALNYLILTVESSGLREVVWITRDTLTY